MVYLIAEMVKFFRYKSYLFQIWNWLEFVLLVVSVVAVVLSLFKAKETKLYVRSVILSKVPVLTPSHASWP